MIDLPLPVGITTSASRPLRTASIGSHCPFWKSLWPKRSVRVRRALARSVEGIGLKKGRNRTVGRSARSRTPGPSKPEPARPRHAAMPRLLADLRYALRVLRASPSFTIVALLSLTLGIGANTTIFSIANGLLLSELPVPHPEQLARVVRGGHSPLDYRDLKYVRENATTISAMIGERLTSGSMA